MEAAASILVLGVLFFVFMFWYGGSVSAFFRSVGNLFHPVTRVLEAGDMHAQVYASEVKVSAINKASKLSVDKKAFAKAKDNLDLINSFSFDAEIENEQPNK